MEQNETRVQTQTLGIVQKHENDSTNSSLLDGDNYALRLGVLKCCGSSCFRRIFAVRGVRDATDEGLNPMPAVQISVHQTVTYHPRKTPMLRPAVTVYQVPPVDLRTLNC